jgi:CHASE3 domain sensor protein
MKIINLIKRHALISSAILLLLLIVGNTVIAIFNHFALQRKDTITFETRDAVRQADQVWTQVVRNVDIGMRGYALVRNDTLTTDQQVRDLLMPMTTGKSDLDSIISRLRVITTKQKFPNPEMVDSLNVVAKDFIKVAEGMVALIREDRMGEFRQILRSDPGKKSWERYNKANTTIRAFEDQIDREAMKSYEHANQLNMVFQVILGLIALPTLGFMIYKINNDRVARRDLFLKLEKNNREFLFNPGGITSTKTVNENEVIDNSILNFKAATAFISQVSNGNFGVQWEGISSENEKLNTSNLAGELMQMRDRMKTIKAQDEIRNWTTEGLAKFSDVIRQNDNNISALSYDILVFLTKYMDAQQGCLFVVQEDLEDGHEYLEMTACYAFNRKKHLTKRLEIGSGIIGQVYLEGTPSLLTDVPNGYTEITSGLGDSTPTSILVVPMRYNQKVEAVIELAGFEKYEKYQVDFMEKVGEITASTLGSVKNTEKMQHLVNQFKSQTEQLRAQEEELRQNMEEMEATQEAMRRQDKDS